MTPFNCRFCEQPLKYSFLDLGMSPLSNAYVPPEKIGKMEAFYPLHVYVCDKCYLVQLPEHESSENIFSDYAYFSSFSDSWLKHVEDYTRMMIERFDFNSSSQVIEVASNDGYLLQFFKKKGVPVLGIEPAKNVAKAAQEAEIQTIVKFFGVQTAKELASEKKYADLLIGNNVLAHVPDLNDFVKGMKIILKPDGIITMEFPHLKRLMEGNQFDTIYHEHFSYFSLGTVKAIFAKHDLTLFDVDEIPTHGGSLRIYVRHTEDESKQIHTHVEELLNGENKAGFKNIKYYLSFEKKVRAIKRKILEFFITSKNEGKTIAGYGAPAKGNTLLNYCGIRNDFMDYTVDRSPYKRGQFLPGTHIPICSPEKINETKPDYIVILPWNLKAEIMEQMRDIRSWGGKFVILIPEVTVYN